MSSEPQKGRAFTKSVLWKMRKAIFIIFGTFFGLMFILGQCSNPKQGRLAQLQIDNPDAYAKEIEQIREKAKREQQEQQRLAEAEITAFMGRLESAELGLKTYFSSERMCRMNLTIMQTCLKALNEATQVILEGQDHQLNAEQQQAIKTLKAKLLTKQKAGLPNMRDAFGPIVRKMLWEENITAKTVGNGYRTIKLTGGWFASNKAIKQVQESMSPMLHRLRFTRSEYYWHKLADEYQYYDIEALADDALVVWQGTTNYYTLVK